jgi:glycerol kinase
MQIQADLLGVPVVRPRVTETTAVGAAFLAGLAGGVWGSRAELGRVWRQDRRFTPRMKPTDRETMLARWKAAVQVA